LEIYKRYKINLEKIKAFNQALQGIMNSGKIAAVPNP
jgi:hypothetical protein